MIKPRLSSSPARPSFLRRGLLIAGVSALAVLCQQPVAAQEDLGAATTNNLPQSQPAPALPPQATQTIQNADAGPRPYEVSTVSESDAQTLQAALQAVRTHSFTEADSLAHSLANPVARKIVTWAIINNDGDIYSFASLDAARRDLWGWPREAKRQIMAEKMMAMSGMSPQQVVDWFSGSPPQSVEGATALITAYGQLNRTADAQALAKTWWRTQVFDSLAQANFYSAFGRYLTPDDSKARVTCLLINTQSGTPQAIRDMQAYVDEPSRLVASAVLAMRTGSAAGDGLYETALSNDPHNPALAFERARYLLKKGLEPLGFATLANLPPATLSPEAASQLYALRLGYFHAALKARDYRAAYNAMNGGGFDNGESKAEAEFFAGWIALVRLHDIDHAITHFQGVAEAGTSPITQGRANYWLGRAYEAKGDAATAQTYYAKGGQYIYAFYGQMAAEKAGIKTITIGHDPQPTAADHERFNNRDLVKAARILGSLNETDLFRQIVLNLDTVLPNAEEEALLVDLTGQYDIQFIAMKVARMSMQRGFYLPDRAYPVKTIPDVPGPEKAFVLAIGRQESGFDATVRSRANARGVMQLVPSTARAVSRRLGLGYSDSKLYEPEYNMTLGAYHLGELVDHFGGSYILAAAGYNAGPSRMSLWIDQCGEPRGANADALSFIECHPFGETRNYMMRVTENVRIYRARLNGGTAPLTAMADITRGIPAAISITPDLDDEGDGSTAISTLSGGSVNGSPVGYLELQKQEAAQAAAEAAAAKFAADNPPPPPKPVAKCHGKHCTAASSAHGKTKATSAKKGKGHAGAASATRSKKKKHR